MGIETKNPEKCYILINLVEKLLNMSQSRKMFRYAVG